MKDTSITRLHVAADVLVYMCMQSVTRHLPQGVIRPWSSVDESWDAATGAACLEDERTFRCRSGREKIGFLLPILSDSLASRLAASLLSPDSNGAAARLAISFVGGSVPNRSNYVTEYRSIVYVLCARHVFSCGVVARAPRLLRPRGVVQASTRPPDPLFGLACCVGQ